MIVGCGVIVGLNSVIGQSLLAKDPVMHRGKMVALPSTSFPVSTPTGNGIAVRLLEFLKISKLSPS
jgi:hypothetical protein